MNYVSSVIVTVVTAYELKNNNNLKKCRTPFFGMQNCN